MLKAFRTRHRAMVILAVLVGTVIAMSYYAEHRKETYEHHAKPSNPVVPVTKGDAGNTAKDADESEHSPSWIDTFAWPDGATAWFLLFTLFVIAWQSAETRSAAKASKKSADAALLQVGLMERQTKVLESSVAAAKDQIQMMRDKEQARIQATPLAFTLLQPSEPNNITIEFVNIGPTNAFDVRVEAGAKVTVDGLKPEQGEYTDLALPTLLKPDKMESSWVVCDFPPRWQNAVLDEKTRICIEVAGQIKYRDVFEAIHTQDFAYRMNVYGIERLPRDFVTLKLMRDWHPFELRPGDWDF